MLSSSARNFFFSENYFFTQIFEDEKEVLKKSKILAELIQSSNIITVHTGKNL